MKRIFIVLLLIIFSSSFSLADNNKKITVKEIEDLLILELKEDLIYYEYSVSNPIEKWRTRMYERERRKAEPSFQKRVQNRGIAKCLYINGNEPPLNRS